MSKQTNVLHFHPEKRTANVLGRQLESAEVIRKDDFYDSTSGKWESVPKQLVGDIVKNNPGMIFVRPAKSKYIRLSK